MSAFDAAPAGERFIIPASLAQQRLSFLADSDPTAIAYNVAKATLIRGPLDVGALRRAIALVVDRHEALRTTFEHINGRLMQVLSASSTVHLVVQPVEQEPGRDLPAIVDCLVRDEARTPFDLRRGPLVRPRLYQLGPERFLFCLTLHHIICDAWSLALLHREVTRAYSACARGDNPELGASPLQYADFAVWEQQQDARREVALAFWRRALAELPEAINWPADYTRAPVPTWLGEEVRIVLPGNAADAIRRLAGEERTTPAVVLLAAFAAFLHRWTGDSDLPIGTPVAGRERVELEDVVGCFVNTVITRFRVEPEMPFRHLVAAGRGIMLDALRHQTASIESVVQATRSPAAGRAAPPIQAMFTLHALGDEDVHGGELEYTPLPARTGTAKCDVTLVAVQSGGLLSIGLQLSRDLFDARTMSAAAAADALGALLAAALASPESSVADLPLTTTGRVSTLQGPSTPYPRDVDTHALFVCAARAHSSAIAIDTGRDQMTYAELHRQADAITVALQDAGVMAGQFVWLLADRGAAMAAGMIGILGAGAVYVPLDPTDCRRHASRQSPRTRASRSSPRRARASRTCRTTSADWPSSPSCTQRGAYRQWHRVRCRLVAMPRLT